MHSAFHSVAVIAVILAGGLMLLYEARKWEPDWIGLMCGWVMVICGLVAGVLLIING